MAQTAKQEVATEDFIHAIDWYVHKTGRTDSRVLDRFEAQRVLRQNGLLLTTPWTGAYNGSVGAAFSTPLSHERSLNRLLPPREEPLGELHLWLTDPDRFSESLRQSAGAAGNAEFRNAVDRAISGSLDGLWRFGSEAMRTRVGRRDRLLVLDRLTSGGHAKLMAHLRHAGVGDRRAVTQLRALLQHAADGNAEVYVEAVRLGVLNRNHDRGYISGAHRHSDTFEVRDRWARAVALVEDAASRAPDSTSAKRFARHLLTSTLGQVEQARSDVHFLSLGRFDAPFFWDVDLDELFATFDEAESQLEAIAGDHDISRDSGFELHIAGPVPPLNSGSAD